MLADADVNDPSTRGTKALFPHQAAVRCGRASGSKCSAEKRVTGAPGLPGGVEPARFCRRRLISRHGYVSTAVEIRYCSVAGQLRHASKGTTASMHWMRAVSIIATLLLLAANAFALLPAASAFQPYLSGATVALGLVVLVALLTGRSPKRPTGSAAAEAGRPAPVPTHASQAVGEVVGFLAILQAKGRLVDFLMDDINAHDDAQIGAAARVVHAGCRGVLQEHFRISPIRDEREGSTVQVAAGYPADEYRLVGKISGPAPFSGVLVHHGWKTDTVKLPRVVRSPTDRLPAIAPAEVELK